MFFDVPFHSRVRSTGKPFEKLEAHEQRNPVRFLSSDALNHEQVVRNGQAVKQASGNSWDSASLSEAETGAGIVSGLRGAKGIDVNEHLVAVAGSHSNAVVVFVRQLDGTIAFLDSSFVGLRSVPSFHHHFNPRSLTLSGPTHLTALESESESQGYSDSTSQTVQTSFALGQGQGPVRIQRKSGEAVSANDAVTFTMYGLHYLAVANHDGFGGGGVSLFLLHRQHPVCDAS